jgi:hypothetical protein
MACLCVVELEQSLRQKVTGRALKLHVVGQTQFLRQSGLQKLGFRMSLANPQQTTVQMALLRNLHQP